jgi:phosphate starvation-inducible PhoH-like protein
MQLQRELETKKNRAHAREGFTFREGLRLKGEKQKIFANKIKENQITIVKGSAGTGKTFVALKCALEMLRDPESDVERILLVKPIVEGGNESIGFLPGGLDDKLEPYKASFVTNMRKLIGDVATQNLFEKEVVKFVYLGHVRGGTFENSVTILDEAQNATVAGMKLFISRKSEESKLIIMGDAEQTDLRLKTNETTGLDDAFLRLQKINGISFMEFGDEDIVRSKILKEIMMRYRKPLEDFEIE